MAKVFREYEKTQEYDYVECCKCGQEAIKETYNPHVSESIIRFKCVSCGNITEI